MNRSLKLSLVLFVVTPLISNTQSAQASIEPAIAINKNQVSLPNSKCQFNPSRGGPHGDGWVDARGRPCTPKTVQAYSSQQVDELLSQLSATQASEIGILKSQLEALQNGFNQQLTERTTVLHSRISELEQTVIQTLDRFDQRVLNQRLFDQMRDQLRAEFRAARSHE